MADNELMVLIYETMQKQLNQFKDSRVVMQTLCSRVGELEKQLAELAADSKAINERLAAAENELKTIRRLENSNVKLTDSINAMRGTISTVVAPGIKLVGDTHKELKGSIRDLTTVHRQVMDEFEQYELRLAQLEDDIKRMMHRQLMRSDITEETRAEEEHAENEQAEDKKENE